MYKHILLPTDGSELSMQAAREAVALAKSSGARITAFFAKPGYPQEYYDDGAPTGPNTPEEFAKSTEKKARRALDSVVELCKKAGVKAAKLSVDSDTPYQAIIDAAAKVDCDLIFMASHGRKGLGLMLLGSVTYKVLTHSKIPVLVHR